MADGGVAAAASVPTKRFKAHSGIAIGISTGIGFERCVTNCGILGAGAITKQRMAADGYVVVPVRVIKESASARVFIRHICEESACANGCVEAVCSVARQREKANCGIELACGETEQRVLAFSGVTARVAPVRRRIDGVCF